MSLTATNIQDTIIALATPPGIGAIGIIRLSGKDAFNQVNAVFKGKDLTKEAPNTIHFGTIRDGNTILDEVLVSLFRAPHSFTKEDVIEISCHGSQYIIREIIKLFVKNGVRLAQPGEFTKRAFLNGQFDLAQAEAVADLIASDSESAHRTAMSQMRGGFSEKLKVLREKLIHFASMIELELDFSEEDVEFASRDELKNLILELNRTVVQLMDSFEAGNVIKNGIPTVIAGKPNAGKSTLLNGLLNEEKAIVSDIPGTTRDFIEDVLVIDGFTFRFVDTAGIRESADKIETMGVERTRAKMKEASLILYLFDLSTEPVTEIFQEINRLENQGTPFIVVGNKSDIADQEVIDTVAKDPRAVIISADQKKNLEALKEKVVEIVNLKSFKTGNTIVTNMRHYQALVSTSESLEAVLTGIDSQVTNDFLAMDIRQSLHHLGEITGEITTDDLLDNIFSKFCIGK
ncbi:MAG: tRNA uridine-5-carboxymethylaminomethyl(34) synthesis GTPase MnmE [Bacteroidota bacterium]